MKVPSLLVAASCVLATADCGPPSPHAPAASLSPEKARVLAFWATFRSATSRRVARDFESAASLYGQALDLDPRHEDSLYYLGQCLRELGRPEEARRSFERLIDVNPQSGRGHLAAGALLASPDAGEPLDLPAAEAHFRRAHEINAEETGPMVRLAEVLVARGRNEEARRWVESAVRSNPRSVEAALLAAYLAREAGNADAARAFAARAHSAARKDAPVKGVLGEGDRRAGGAPSATPPLESPMGRMLFEEALALARAQATDEATPLDLEALSRAVARTRREHVRRAARVGAHRG